MKTYPYKLPFGVQVFGSSMPVWAYDRVPEGMRQIRSIRELWNGRTYLTASALSPGEYITGYMRPAVRPVLEKLLASGQPVYVKDI